MRGPGDRVPGRHPDAAAARAGTAGGDPVRAAGAWLGAAVQPGPGRAARRVPRRGGGQLLSARHRGLPVGPARFGHPGGGAAGSGRRRAAAGDPAAALPVRAAARAGRLPRLPARRLEGGADGGPARPARRPAELRRPPRRARAQERAGRIPGPGPRGGGRARAGRDLLRGVPGADRAVARAAPARRPPRRGRGSWLALAAVHGRARGARGGAGPGGPGRHGGLRARRGRGRRRGDDARAPLPHRGRHDGGTARRADRLGPRAGRADRRGRLRRRVPLRPGSAGLPAGDGAGPGGFRRHDQQDAGPGAAAGLAGSALMADRRRGERAAVSPA